MRVLIINQFFYPDISAISQQITDVAEDMAARGVEVTVLTGRQRYIGGGAQLPKSEEYHGIRIVRVPAARYERVNLVRRMFSYLSFYFFAAFRALTLSRHDVIMVMTAPPMIALVAWMVSVVRGSKVVYLAQDLYPDVALHLGILREGSLLARVLERLSRFTFRHSDAIIVLGECMKRRIVAKGIADQKIYKIPNWADATRIHGIAPEENPFRAKHGMGDKFVVLYSGNIGKAHDVDTVIEAARILRDDSRILFVFIGDGPRKSQLEAGARDHHLANMQFLPYQSRDDLRFSLSAGDVSLVTMLAEAEGLVIPSKLYGIMAVARPVLYVGPATSEIGLTLERHDCGVVIPNGDAAGLAAAIRKLAGDPALASRYGNNARSALEQYYDRPRQTAQYLDVAMKVAAGRG